MLSLISIFWFTCCGCVYWLMFVLISYLHICGHWVWAPNAVAASSPTCFADAVHEMLVDAVAARWNDKITSKKLSRSTNQVPPCVFPSQETLKRNLKPAGRNPLNRWRPCMDLKSMQVNLVNMQIPEFDGHPLQYLGMASGKIHQLYIVQMMSHQISLWNCNSLLFSSCIHLFVCLTSTSKTFRKATKYWGINNLWSLLRG